MEIENYKPNSDLSKKAAKEGDEKIVERRAEKVIDGSAKKKRKSGARKFADAIIQRDVHAVMDYVVNDVVIPSVRDIISSIINNATDMALYGETRGRRPRDGTSRVSYRNYYDRDRDRDRDRRSRNSAYDYDEIIFDSRGEAERVLDGLEDLIERYRIATVCDLYDLSGIADFPHTANKYGWTDVSKASVVRGFDGYTIRLPKAYPID